MMKKVHETDSSTVLAWAPLQLMAILGRGLHSAWPALRGRTARRCSLWLRRRYAVFVWGNDVKRVDVGEEKGWKGFFVQQWPA
jgi:hypothetical protein